MFFIYFTYVYYQMYEFFLLVFISSKYFLLVFSLSFHYLVVSFKEQNLKILMKSNLLFFSFMSLAF